MIPLNVKASLELKDEKNPDKVKLVSFNSPVYDIDKRIISDRKSQVLKTMFLLYDSKHGFVWVSASCCAVVPGKKK